MADEIKKEQENSKQKPERIRSNNTNLLFAAILFFALLSVLFFSFNYWIGNKQKEYNNNPINRVYPNVTSDAENQGDNFTQTNGDQSSGVEVTAVYEKEKSQNQTFFKLYFNTHAVDYSNYDFQENIVIKDPQGKVYKAVNIVKEGAGHHQSVEMAFPLAASPFKLSVKNLAGVAERTFSW